MGGVVRESSLVVTDGGGVMCLFFVGLKPLSIFLTQWKRGFRAREMAVTFQAKRSES